MDKPNISKVLTEANKTDLATNAAAIWVILDFMVNLDPATRKRLRKMATKRTGYVLDVYTAVMANPGAIPSTFSIDEYKKDKLLLDDLNLILGLYRPIVEAIEDTILTLGNEMMTQSDTCYGYLQRGAKGNVPLTETINKIATAYKRKSPKMPVVYLISAGGTVVVDGVIPGTRLVNNGTTVIKLKGGNLLASKVRVADIMIDPGNSAIIPKGYTQIAVENTSASIEGSFSVRQK